MTRTAFSRRSGIAMLTGLMLAGLVPATGTTSATASESPAWRHGISLFDSVKYPADFKHFDYVNPQAPKGGTVRQVAIGTFDSFNFAIASVRGTVSFGINNLYDSLMVSALDEVSTEYGLVAEAVSHPEDFSWAKFRLRPQARCR